MRRYWKDLIYFFIVVFLLVRLALTYSEYSHCCMPIHHWYLGCLVFLLTFRVLLICINNFQVGNICLVLLGCLIGPCTFIFVLSWNIIGTAYLVDILSNPNRNLCISTGTLVIVLITLALVYLFYLVLLIATVSFIRQKKNMKSQKLEVKKKLIEAYEVVTGEKALISLEVAQKVKESLHSMIQKKSNILKNFEMFDEEKEVMSLFFVPGMLQNPNWQEDLNRSVSKKSVLPGENLKNSRLLADPLLKMIGKERVKEEMEKRITNLIKNSEQDSGDCIICFSSLENARKKVVLKCQHSFHSVCLFDWLKINPSCPICRKNFRLDLLYAILAYLDGIILREKKMNQKPNTIPLLGNENV